MKYTRFLVALMAAASFATPAKAENNMLLILDASNSMWGQVDGTAKIETARGVLGDLLSNLPDATKVGVMAYGHGDKESCTDVAVLSPISDPDPAALKKTIGGIQPKGKTPIAYALEQGGKELAKFEQDSNNIVLISDGIETCEGDPCAAAEKLAASNINTKVHVVGFDVDDETRKQLQCIAEKGKGKYFDATNTAGFKTAIAEVKKVAVEPIKKKEPAKPAGIWFEDNFDGSELSGEWEVLNPKPDNYIVEDGKLQVVYAQEQEKQGADNVENMFKLKKGMPEGNWVATMRIIPEVQTMRERYDLMVYKDPDNLLVATAGNYVECCGYSANLGLWSDKRSAGKNTEFTTKALVSEGLGGFRSGTENVKNFTGWMEKNASAIELRITKKGRDYVVAMRTQNDKDNVSKWIELEKLNSLRLPGDNFVLAFRQMPFTNANYQVQGGESLVNVDWVRIESLK